MPARYPPQGIREVDECRKRWEVEWCLLLCWIDGVRASPWYPAIDRVIQGQDTAGTFNTLRVIKVGERNASPRKKKRRKNERTNYKAMYEW